MFSALSDRIGQPLARLPIRLRLAVSVAAVAFVILILFAIVVGKIQAHRLRSEFNSQAAYNAQQIAGNHFHLLPDGQLTPSVSEIVPNQGAVILVWVDGRIVGSSQSANPKLGDPASQLNDAPNAPAVTDYNGYQIYTYQLNFGGGFLQYAQPLSSVDGEVDGLEILLFLGALIGTAIAFGAGALVARRAIAPVAQLTAAAAEIERTRDPDLTLPTSIADDEIAELSRTLTGMLTSLSAARNETEGALERQRDFVADASHELRTPLTSVLANLELLVDSLRGPDREAAASALRSTQRMRRLVGDLLLLARADAGQSAPPRERLDLADVVVEAASELEPAAAEHTIELDVRSTPLLGNRDDLQRVTTNLIENALRHTPPGTRVTATTRTLPDGSAQLVVADDGPGIPAQARATLFDRFVRGSGDRGGSFGLGLAIVAAVTQAHRGTVTVDESPHGGARFTVRLPVAAPETQPLQTEPAAPLTQA